MKGQGDPEFEIVLYLSQIWSLQTSAAIFLRAAIVDIAFRLATLWVVGNRYRRVFCHSCNLVSDLTEGSLLLTELGSDKDMENGIHSFW